MQGWIKIHRQITDSDIYKMPPLYMRVFERLVIEANHKDVEIPYREKGSKVYGKKLIKRGERLTSIRNISEWVAWYERGCLKIPNPKTISSVLDYLIQENMIFIYNKGNNKETHYKVVNYDIYQDSTEEESNTKVTTSKQLLDTNKNDKNVKNDKKNIYSLVIEYLNKKAGTKYRGTTKKTQSCINARINEGFKEDDFYTVIDNKVNEWQGTDMEKYLRPETLFGNKFEGYLNQKSISNKSSVNGSQNTNTGWNGYKKFE